jgi:hypothetical protein
MLISFALREFTIPPQREIRSLLGFRDKSAKKSRNFRCYAQKPSILPRSCPTCWDITQSFCHVIFLGLRRPLEEEVNEERHEDKKKGHHMGTLAGRMVGPISGLVGPIAANFDSMDSSFLKGIW